MFAKTMAKRLFGRSNDGNAAAIQTAMNRIQEVSINFLAIDFDQTFIDIHTGGVWPGTLEEIISHVRPEFRDLLVRAYLLYDCLTMLPASLNAVPMQNVIPILPPKYTLFCERWKRLDEKFM